MRLCGRFPYRPTIGGACGMYRLAISIATIFGTRLATIFGTRPSSALEMSRGPPSAPGPWAPTHLRGWTAAEPNGERGARSAGPAQARQDGRAADARGYDVSKQTIVFVERKARRDSIRGGGSVGLPIERQGEQRHLS